MSQELLTRSSCPDYRLRPRAFPVAMSRCLALCSALVLGCGGSGGGGGSGTGGSHPSASGGQTGSGGATASGGNTGAISSGGTVVTGGSVSTGVSTGGVAGSGGNTSTGGKSGTGGNTSTGGAPSTGGKAGSGGMVSTGGASETGGATGTGGSNSTGGSLGSGGATSKDGGLGSGGSTAGGAGAGGNSAGGSSGSRLDGGSGSSGPSAGCGKTPTLKNSPTQNTISGSRQFIIHWPTDYNNNTPYRLIFNLHGAGGSDTETSGNNYGLWSLSNGSTIFVSLSAAGGYWDGTTDTTYASDVLKAVEADLCIDTTRIMLEGFSQGAAMARVLACSFPGVFRAIVAHSAGGVNMPSTCQPIPYLGSLGLSDVAGNSQATQTDPFAKWNGCTIENLPTSSTGSHVCTNYKGCPAADPVIWCSFDGPHTPSPTDAGKSTSWMPSVVWPFMSQF